MNFFLVAWYLNPLQFRSITWIFGRWSLYLPNGSWVELAILSFQMISHHDDTKNCVLESTQRFGAINLFDLKKFNKEITKWIGIAIILKIII